LLTDNNTVEQKSNEYKFNLTIATVVHNKTTKNSEKIAVEENLTVEEQPI